MDSGVVERERVGAWARQRGTENHGASQASGGARYDRCSSWRRISRVERVSQVGARESGLQEVGCFAVLDPGQPNSYARDSSRRQSNSDPDSLPPSRQGTKRLAAAAVVFQRRGAARAARHRRCPYRPTTAQHQLANTMMLGLGGTSLLGAPFRIHELVTVPKRPGEARRLPFDVSKGVARENTMSQREEKNREARPRQNNNLAHGR